MTEKQAIAMKSRTNYLATVNGQEYTVWKSDIGKIVNYDKPMETFPIGNVTLIKETE